MSNEIDKKLFEQIFGHTLIKLADKLINTTNKEENQIIVKNSNKNNNNKLFEMDDFDDFVIQPSDQRIDLTDAIDLILDFNKNKNENENKNDETLMPSDKDDDKTMRQNEIKKLNDNLDEITDKSKSFEEQIESLKKLKDLKRHWPYKGYDDKELKSKYLKIKLADMYVKWYL